MWQSGANIVSGSRAPWVYLKRKINVTNRMSEVQLMTKTNKLTALIAADLIPQPLLKCWKHGLDLCACRISVTSRFHHQSILKIYVDEFSLTISYIPSIVFTCVFSMVGRIHLRIWIHGASNSLLAIVCSHQQFGQQEAAWMLTDQAEQMTHWTYRLWSCAMSFLQMASLIFPAVSSSESAQ